MKPQQSGVIVLEVMIVKVVFLTVPAFAMVGSNMMNAVNAVDLVQFMNVDVMTYQKVIVIVKVM